jgi:hypothetical protein
MQNQITFSETLEAAERGLLRMSSFRFFVNSVFSSLVLLEGRPDNKASSYSFTGIDIASVGAMVFVFPLKSVVSNLDSSFNKSFW